MRFFLKIARLPEFLIFQSKLFHSDKVEGKNTCVLAYSYLFIIKMATKMKRGMLWLFDYLVNFYLIYFLLHVEELSFCFQFFLIAIFILLVMTNKQNAVLFTNQSRCGWVMMNEWLILSGLNELQEFCCYVWFH